MLDPPRPQHRQATPSSRTRRVLCVGAFMIAAVLALPTIQHAMSGQVAAHAAEHPREPACSRWDEAASDAILQLVEGQPQLDLRLVSDAVFRLRRARRNCLMGWPHLACLDYHAVIRGEPARTSLRLQPSRHCSLPGDEAMTLE